MSSRQRPILSPGLFRYLCLITAIANAGGNLFLFFFHKPVFDLFGVPPPQDMHSFAFVCGFSFTIGVLAFLVYLEPFGRRDLLVVAIVGKAIYAGLTAYYYHDHGLHWFYRIFGLWDAAFTVVFFLYLIQLVSDDLDGLNASVIRPGVPGARQRKALILYYSLTKNGERAMERLRKGLESKNYDVDQKLVEPEEALFHFPFHFAEFLRIMLRAIVRVPARVKPLGIPASHSYDLIVVECQTWFIGMGAPMEGVFQDPDNRAIFAGRDVAGVVLCRGLWRRTQSMLVRWLERSGGNVVGARAFENPGPEPSRTFSLFFFLGAGKERKPSWLKPFLQPQYLSGDSLAKLEDFGRALAERPAADDVSRRVA